MENFSRIFTGLGLCLALLTPAEPAGPARTVIVKGTAPAGSRVSVGGGEFPVDSTGHWIGAFTPAGASDSASVAWGSGRQELCLIDGADRICTTFDPGAFDTVE